MGAVGRTAGGEGLGSGTRAGSRLVTRSVSAVTWLDKADRVEVVDADEAQSAPISPVTWENAVVSSEFNLVSCTA